MNIIPKNLSQSDRIGKFTLPELAVIAAGVFLIMVNIMIFNLFFGLIIAIPIAILTFLTIKLKINDLPAYKFLFVWLIYQTQPKELLYRTDNRKIIRNEELLIEFTEHENLFDEFSEEDDNEIILKSNWSAQRNKKVKKHSNSKKTEIVDDYLDDFEEDEDFFS